VSAARRSPWALFVLVLYAAVLCISPAFRHDFDCHEKSPARCSACMASPTAEDARVKAPAAAPSLGEGEDPQSG
jgi:hypothetical protein